MVIEATVLIQLVSSLQGATPYFCTMHALLICVRRGLLCCAVLCCAVLCCAVLCCAVLCCAVLCCAVLCCAAPCRAVPCCALPCRAAPCHVDLTASFVQIVFAVGDATCEYEQDGTLSTTKNFSVSVKLWVVQPKFCESGFEDMSCVFDVWRPVAKLHSLTLPVMLLSLMVFPYQASAEVVWPQVISIAQMQVRSSVRTR